MHEKREGTTYLEVYWSVPSNQKKRHFKKAKIYMAAWEIRWFGAEEAEIVVQEAHEGLESSSRALGCRWKNVFLTLKCSELLIQLFYQLRY